MISGRLPKNSNSKNMPNREKELLGMAKEKPEMLDLCRATTYPGGGLDLDNPLYMIDDLNPGLAGQKNVGVTTYGFWPTKYWNSLYNYYAVRPELEFDNLEELTNEILSGESSSIENGYLKGTVYLPSKYLSSEEFQQLAELYEDEKLKDTKTVFPTNKALEKGGVNTIFGVAFFKTDHPIYEYNGKFYLFYNMKHDVFLKKNVKLKNGKMREVCLKKTYDFNIINIEPRELLIDPEGKLAIFQDLVFAGIMYDDLPTYFPLFIQGIKDIKRLVERTKTQEHKKTESNDRATSETDCSTEFAKNQSDTPTSVTNNPTTINENEHSEVAKRAKDLKETLQDLLDKRKQLTEMLAKVDKQIGETIEEIAGNLAKDRE